MPDPGQDGENGESRDEPAADPGFDDAVERAFTCSLCGFATTYEVGPLRAEVQSVCVNCGDWTVQTAAVEELVEAAREVAETLEGQILTERQALAYLLRDVVGVDRSTAAEAMDSTPSNVDNLQRRGAAKVAEAERLISGLDSLLAPAEVAGDDGTEVTTGDEGTTDTAAGDGAQDATAGDDAPSDRRP